MEVEVRVASLLAQLGAVCDGCSTFNEPGIPSCAGCGAGLPVVALVRGATPPGEPTSSPSPHLATDTEPGPVARRQAPTAPPGKQTGERRPQQLAPPTLPPDPAPPRGTGIRRPGVPPLPRGPCPRCSSLNPPGIQFCPSCGARLVQTPQRHVPLAPGAVHLTLLRGMGAALSTHPLTGPITRLGRNTGDIRFPADATLSGHAATFLFRDGRLTIKDEGCGVFVRLRQPELLSQGALVAVGDQLLRFGGLLDGSTPPGHGPAPFGSPYPGTGPWIRLQSVVLGGGQGRAWIRELPVRLGRALGDVLLTEDPFVSARHCEFDLDQESRGVIVRDLGSSNGTFLKIPQGGEWELQPGDTLRLGRNILRLDQVA